MAASTATSAIMESGLGKFNQIELNKKLAGKVVRVSPRISSLSEGVSGSASPEDIETMFQLIYLIFTEPRADSLAFQALLDRYRGILQKPGYETNDSLFRYNSSYHVSIPRQIAPAIKRNTGRNGPAKIAGILQRPICRCQ